MKQQIDRSDMDKIVIERDRDSDIGSPPGENEDDEDESEPKYIPDHIVIKNYISVDYPNGFKIDIGSYNATLNMIQKVVFDIIEKQKLSQSSERGKVNNYCG